MSNDMLVQDELVFDAFEQPTPNASPYNSSNSGRLFTSVDSILLMKRARCQEETVQSSEEHWSINNTPTNGTEHSYEDVANSIVAYDSLDLPRYSSERRIADANRKRLFVDSKDSQEKRVRFASGTPHEISSSFSDSLRQDQTTVIFRQPSANLSRGYLVSNLTAQSDEDYARGILRWLKQIPGDRKCLVRHRLNQVFMDERQFELFRSTEPPSSPDESPIPFNQMFTTLLNGNVAYGSDLCSMYRPMPNFMQAPLPPRTSTPSGQLTPQNSAPIDRVSNSAGRVPSFFAINDSLLLWEKTNQQKSKNV